MRLPKDGRNVASITGAPTPDHSQRYTGSLGKELYKTFLEISYRTRLALIFHQVDTTRLYFSDLKHGFLEGPWQSPEGQQVRADKNRLTWTKAKQVLKILRDILNIPKTGLEPTEPEDTGSVNLTTASKKFFSTTWGFRRAASPQGATTPTNIRIRAQDSQVKNWTLKGVWKFFVGSIYTLLIFKRRSFYH